MASAGKVIFAQPRNEVGRACWKQWSVLATGPALVAVGEAAAVQLGLSDWVGYLAVLLLGALTAVAELLSRYRDDPLEALTSISAVVYLSVNAAAAVGALAAVRVFDWDFGATGTQLAVLQVLAAGLGSAAIFRSSLLNYTAGDQNIAIGPNVVLSVLLAAADRGVDRQQALTRFRQARLAMAGVSFEDDAEELRHLVIATMQNVSSGEERDIESVISAMRTCHLSDETKAMALGLALITLVGADVVQEATRQLRERKGRTPASAPSPTPAPAPSPTPTPTPTSSPTPAPTPAPTPSPMSHGGATEDRHPAVPGARPAVQEQLVRSVERVGGRRPYREVQSEMGLSLVPFAMAVDGLRDQGQIDLDGPCGREDIVLRP